MHIDIIFGILLTLLRKEKVTAKYLASKFEISTRTVYRYLSILDSNNIPIMTKKGKDGGIYLNNAISTNSIFFTTAEKITLLNLTNSIKCTSLRDSITSKLMVLK